MAEGDAIVTNIFKAYVLEGAIDCENDNFRIALYTAALASPDGSPAYTAVNEIVAANYVATGALVSVPVVAQDDVNDRASWDDDGSNVTWNNLGVAAILEARLYDDTIVAPLVADPVCILWEIATNSNGGNYTLQFHANGILLLS